MSKRIKTGLATAAVIVLSVVGGGLAIALPAQANTIISHAVTGGVTNDGETADDNAGVNGTNDGESADGSGVEDGTNDGETADDNGVEDGTNDGETNDDAGN